MTRSLAAALAATMLLASCIIDPIGIKLRQGWKATSLAVWNHMRPDMMVASKDRRFLYISCENSASLETPSLLLYNLKNGHRSVLISGLERADGLKQAPDGSLWLGEEFDRGLIWRIAQPDQLPEGQMVERHLMRSSHPAITPLRRAGQFAHEGIAFSADGQYAYLPDEQSRGALFRYRFRPPHLLQVMGADGKWLAVADPSQARAIANQLHASTFNHMEDIERLANGHLLIAESHASRILELIDHGQRAEMRTYLEDPRIHRPDNLAWDASRNWLWITDDDHPSILWAWDGNQLMQIASHKDASITGVLPLDGDILINLQGGSLQGSKSGSELTLRLHEEFAQ